ncbi:pilus assembly protein [Nocardiopsis sp. MG754419]|uniref:pilus assembly protein n=1 Tax=Nocardiopsis sp. MG754419 TaxID=2259865 RepID=UPI0027DE76AA|nr:pilus assembly protein [Nocardiopsis sp. MG754419]
MEFAAMVPFMMLALALVWQVLLIGLTSMYASHGAAEAARQAAVTPDDMERIDEEARKRVSAPWDAPDVLTTTVVDRDGVRYAQVTVAMPVFFPGTNGPWDITGEAQVVTEVTPRGGLDQTPPGEPPPVDDPPVEEDDA